VTGGPARLRPGPAAQRPSHLPQPSRRERGGDPAPRRGRLRRRL